MPDVSDLSAAIQQAIDNGATTVEEIHKSIAGMPFDQLAKLAPGLEDTAGQARDVHHRTIGTVYDMIRSVNKAVGDLAPKMLGGSSSAE